MSTPITSPAPADNANFRVGYILFGGLEILVGALCGLMTLPVLLAASISTPAPGMDLRAAVVAVAFYLLLAVCFVWLGVGSILCRRWARTLLLILAWSWLVAGVMSVGFLALVLPPMMQRLSSGRAALVVSLVVLGLVALFFVVIPGGMILFYQSKRAQATVKALDPRPRWTDACPLPVLTTALWFAIGAVSFATMPFVYGSGLPVPCFGRLISGPVATALSLLIAAVWLWLAWAFYRLQLNGLWASIIFCVVWFASAAVTYVRVDFLEMYRLMGYPPEQIEAIRQMGLFGGHLMVWLTALMGVAAVLFLVWLRKYFPSENAAATTTPLP